MAGVTRASDFGHIEKRSSGNYRATFINPRYGKRTGEKRRIERTFRLKSEAAAWLASQQSAINRGVWLSPLQTEEAARAEEQARRESERPFSDYADAWFRLKRVSWSPRTISRYESIYRRIVRPYWGDRTLSHIRKTDVKEWVSRLVGYEHHNTALKSFEIFRAIMLSALDDEVIDRTPFVRGISSPLKRAAENSPRKHSHRALEAWELDRLMHGLDVVGTDGKTTHVEGLPRQYRFLTWFMVMTGLRIGEAVALQRGDFDLKAGTFRVERQYTQRQVDKPKTRSSIKTIQMAPGLVADVREHFESLPVSGKTSLVFPSESNDFIRWDSYAEAIDWACKRLGLEKFRPHDLRRTAITQALRNGASLRDVQSFSRHATASMVMRYAQTDARHEQATASSVYEALNLGHRDGSVTVLPSQSA